MLLLLLTIILVQSVGAERKLVLVHAIWRHGDRTPVTHFPADKNNTPDTWYQGLGEVIPKGLEQTWQLGEMLRLRYQNDYKLVNRAYLQNEIYIRSSDYNRTLMSAYATTAAFYANAPPLIQSPKWPGYWQPIPVHSIPQEQDYLLRMSFPCPMVLEIQKKEVWTSPEYLGNQSLYQNLFDYLSQHTKVNFKVALNNVWQVADPLEAEERHGRQWPNFINRTIFAQVKKTHDISAQQVFQHRKIQRLRGGPLVGEIINRMQQKRSSLTSLVNDPNMHWVRKLKFYGYSAHDMTILALLENIGAAQVTDGTLPQFASCLLFELWQDRDQFEVLAFYRKGSKATTFVPIPIKGCSRSDDGRCLLDTFYEQAKDRIPSDWFSECKVSSGTVSRTGYTRMWQFIYRSIRYIKSHWFSDAATTVVILISSLFR